MGKKYLGRVVGLVGADGRKAAPGEVSSSLWVDVEDRIVHVGGLGGGRSLDQVDLGAVVEFRRLQDGEGAGAGSESRSPGYGLVRCLIKGQGQLPNMDSDWAYLRRKGTLANLRKRARLTDALRQFFNTRDFVEVETPIMARCPGVEVHLPAVACDTAHGTRYLITSPEFHMKRLITAGMERIYQLTRSFRDGERGEWHNPEFTILEWYRAPASYLEIMDDCEALLVTLAQQACQTGVQREGEEHPDEPLTLTYGSRTVSLERPFPRLTMYQAFRDLAHCDLDQVLASDDGEEQFFRIMIEQVEPAMAAMGVPVFLVDWPVQMASLAEIKEGGVVAERFELYAAGLELANGFTEVGDGPEMEARMTSDLEERKAGGLPLYPVDELYIQALNDGLPPSGGVAVGVDRLMMLLLDSPTIDGVLGFPTERT